MIMGTSQKQKNFLNSLIATKCPQKISELKSKKSVRIRFLNQTRTTVQKPISTNLTNQHILHPRNV